MYPRIMRTWRILVILIFVLVGGGEVGGTSVFATCDNVMKVYADGVLQYQDNADLHNWGITTELVIPSGTKMLAIECLNQGGPMGILASTSDGLVTDRNWMCSSNQNLEGWAEPGFNDTNGDFSSAINFSTNGVSPWGLRPNIARDAYWIWGNNTSNWAACRQFIGAGTSVFATCDNVMKVYADGVLQYQDNADPNANPYTWSITTELVIPSGTKVLAIECLNQGGLRGILASTSDGLVTDRNWMCSSNQNLEGWAEPGFNDTNGDFSTAIYFSTNGGAPWGQRPNIANDAYWIWGENTSNWAACRKKL